jgi:hypothetical protein
MADLTGFNANNVEPTTDFEPIPEGKYLAIITDSEMKPTKSGNGQYLELTFRVVGGPYENRVLWSLLNLDNPSAQAVQIAQGELSAICRAVGVMQPRDSSELHDIPLTIGVVLKRRADTDKLTNEVKTYSRKDVITGAPRQEAAGTPPWARR